MKDLEIVHNFIKELEDTLISSLVPFPLLGILTTQKRLLPIPLDSKVISKLFETLTEEAVLSLAEKHPDIKVLIPDTQNQYPDFSIMTPSGELYAVDIKSSYKKSASEINGMTLGTFMGYFRGENKNIQFPYSSYKKHFCLCFIYERSDKLPFKSIDAANLDNLEVESTIKNVEVFIREKWQIASRSTGSGNTNNMGSLKSMQDLRNKPLFLDEEEFHEYWKNK